MKRKQINIVFLDIDGVLTENFELKHGSFVHGRQAPFRSSAKENLHVLQYYSKCKFVVTSSWRTQMSLDDLRMAFMERGLHLYIHDVTPAIGAERGQEIDLWLDTNKWDNYIVIDDHIKDIKHWCKNIVKVDPNKGFTEDNMNLGLAFLKV